MAHRNPKTEKEMKTIVFWKHDLVLWTTICLSATALLLSAGCSDSTSAAKAPDLLEVEVVAVEQKDVPIYAEWIGTLSGQVNADIKAQVTGYLLTQNYKEGSYVRKGQLLFEIDSRPFQAALDQAKGQLAQAEAQLVQEEARLATAEANELKSQLDVEKYDPLVKADAVSKQDFDNAVQTNVANDQPQFHPHRFPDRWNRRHCPGAGGQFSQHQQRSANHHFDARSHQRLLQCQRAGISGATETVLGIHGGAVEATAHSG